jgi:hypothetical protein
MDDSPCHAAWSLAVSVVPIRPLRGRPGATPVCQVCWTVAVPPAVLSCWPRWSGHTRSIRHCAERPASWRSASRRRADSRARYMQDDTCTSAPPAGSASFMDPDWSTRCERSQDHTLVGGSDLAPPLRPTTASARRWVDRGISDWRNTLRCGRPNPLRTDRLRHPGPTRTTRLSVRMIRRRLQQRLRRTVR